MALSISFACAAWPVASRRCGLGAAGLWKAAYALEVRGPTTRGSPNGSRPCFMVCDMSLSSPMRAHSLAQPMRAPDSLMTFSYF